MEVQVSTTTEPLDFVHRYTNLGGGEVRIEVGDRFESRPEWGATADGMMCQVGMDLLSMGLQCLGHGEASRQLFLALALKAGERTDGD